MEPEPEPEVAPSPRAAGPDWRQERFTLGRPTPAEWAVEAGGVDAIPSLSSLCLVWLARRLDDIESLEGLPPEFAQLACFAASRRAPWSDPRSCWDDAVRIPPLPPTPTQSSCRCADVGPDRADSWCRGWSATASRRWTSPPRRT